MIGGLIEHDGRVALAVHLCKLDENETVDIRTHGLSAHTIADAIAELRLMSLGCRSAKPLIHAWASPSVTYSHDHWEQHRAAFESEFGLVGHPCLEVFHVKFGVGGRTSQHVHRVYLRIDLHGRAVRTSHSAARQEKVSRIAEFEAGERLISGCFNTSVIDRLQQEGRHDVANAMLRAGFGQSNASSAPTSDERAAAERLRDFAPDDVWRRAAAAWRRSDNAASFASALSEGELRLAMGTKTAVVITPAGAIYPLLRAINKGSERQGGRAVRKSDLDSRLRGLDLPAASQLGPTKDFTPGAFSILNLDRLLQPKQQADASTTVGFQAAEPRPVATPLLTKLQEAALLELEEAFYSVAAARAKATRIAVEADVRLNVERHREKRLLRTKVVALAATWEQPSIGVVGWREAYRAQLAGLPASVGMHLQWVDRLDAQRSQVKLWSGVIITLAPTVAHATKATVDTVVVMIEHARAENWQDITITGGTLAWRIQMTEAAIRAGMTVTNPDLAGAVATVRDRIAQEQLLTRWQELSDFSAGMDERKANTEIVLQVLDRISQAPDIVMLIDDETTRKRLLDDLDAYQRYTMRLLRSAVITGPAGLG